LIFHNAENQNNYHQSESITDIIDTMAGTYWPTPMLESFKVAAKESDWNLVGTTLVGGEASS
jgi:hypothetical protein